MSMVEVAKLAGVSHATVSRVINNQPGVSARKVQLVRDAMRRIGYTPPARRRGRQRKRSNGVRTGNIALLMDGTDPALATAPVTAVVLHAAEDALAERGFNLIVGQIAEGGRLPPTVASGYVDGLLMHGKPPSPAVTEQLKRYPCVWVLSPRRPRGYWGDRVGPDNAAIGAMAADYLADRGHTSMAFLHANPTHIGFAQRLEAFVQRAEERGVRAHAVTEGFDRSALPVHGVQTQEPMDALIERALGRSPRPTGFFIQKDRITVLAYRSLREHGLEPGEDVEVISCDNDSILELLEPRPATIDIRATELGRRAVEQLLWRMRHADAPMTVNTTIEPRLVPAVETARRRAGNGS